MTLIGPARGLVVIMVGWLLIGVASACDDNSASKDPRTGAPIEMAGPVSAKLVARSQQILSERLIVDRAVLDSPGYVAVYADGGGAPGKRIGQSKLLKTGKHDNVSVRLANPPKGGNNVWVMLHHEDNTNRSLDFPTADQPVASDNGVMVVVVPILPDSK